MLWRCCRPAHFITTLLIIGVASYNFTVTFPLFIERGLHGSDVQYTLFYAACQRLLSPSRLVLIAGRRIA